MKVNIFFKKVISIFYYISLKKSIKIILIFFTITIPNKSLYSNSFDIKEGEKLYLEKKYNKAKVYFKKSVESGHSEAETMTGIMFLKGQGYKQNPIIAAIWFFKASIQGNNNAQLILGTQYLYGYGIKKDYIKAYKWLKLSSNSNDIKVSTQANEFIKFLRNEVGEKKFKIIQKNNYKLKIKKNNFK